ncbi:hypothetical protein [Paenibacillus bovis]|uniref:Uncharacterized protein n=1 Tax=Paenibacillus bovis TaxID=1616788 RepID=A0A172ZEP6_9BACL|nr:hypothetical protein [Paenibacillus bovis]ANF95973.1 hypothetical protein AR543_08105 [Paenibacillus bovis]
MPKIRATLKSRLADIIPEWKGKVLDLPLPDTVLTAPCVVITFAEEIQKSSWAGYRRIIKIWPYAQLAGGGMEIVEGWSEKVIAQLHNQRLEDDQGHAFTCVYLGSSEGDRVDLLSGLMTRPLRFGVYVPEQGEDQKAATSQLTTASQEMKASAAQTDATDGANVLAAVTATDPWLEALNQWTRQQLGSSWSIYNDAWPSGYLAPSILWRLTGVSTAASGTSAFDLRKQWVGHVYAASEKENKHIASELVQRLNAEVRIPLNLLERRYLTVSEASADLQADAFLNGQIRLTLLHRTQRKLPDAPLIRQVTNKPVLDY